MPGAKLLPPTTTTTEKLEPRNIEGVIAEGTRQTTTFPVGWQGNDSPISMIYENWYSPGLKRDVLFTLKDTRTADLTHQLINVRRSEQDASLFQLPPDYTVMDEAGAFTIKWQSQ